MELITSILKKLGASNRECNRLERKLQQLLGVVRPVPIVVIIDGDVEDGTNVVQVVQRPTSIRKAPARQKRVAKDSTEKRTPRGWNRSTDAAGAACGESTEGSGVQG